MESRYGVCPTDLPFSQMSAQGLTRTASSPLRLISPGCVELARVEPACAELKGSAAGGELDGSGSLRSLGGSTGVAGGRKGERTRGLADGGGAGGGATGGGGASVRTPDRLGRSALQRARGNRRRGGDERCWCHELRRLEPSRTAAPHRGHASDPRAQSPLGEPLGEDVHELAARVARHALAT